MDRKAARRFGCQPGSRWLRIAYVRASTKPKSPPLAWVDCYVEESYADAVSDIKKDRRLVCDMIADSYGVIASEVHQTVAATVIRTRSPRRWEQKPDRRARSHPPISGRARPPVRDIGKHPSRRPIRRDVGAQTRRQSGDDRRPRDAIFRQEIASDRFTKLSRAGLSGRKGMPPQAQHDRKLEDDADRNAGSAHPQAIPFRIALRFIRAARRPHSIVKPAFWISGTQRLISDWT